MRKPNPLKERIALSTLRGSLTILFARHLAFNGFDPASMGPGVSSHRL